MTTRLLSSLVSEEAVARVQGNLPGAILRSDFAQDWEFEAMRNLREQHLHAIRTGRMEDYLLTPGQLLGKMEELLRDCLKALERLI